MYSNFQILTDRYDRIAIYLDHRFCLLFLLCDLYEHSCLFHRNKRFPLATNVYYMPFPFPIQVELVKLMAYECH